MRTALGIIGFVALFGLALFGFAPKESDCFARVMDHGVKKVVQCRGAMLPAQCRLQNDKGVVFYDCTK